MEAMMSLGRSGLQVSRLGVGAMTWGEARGLARFHPAKTAYGGPLSRQDEQAAFDASLAAGVCLFDSAAMYAGGASERRLGECLNAVAGLNSVEGAAGRDVVIATKFPAGLRATAE